MKKILLGMITTAYAVFGTLNAQTTGLNFDGVPNGSYDRLTIADSNSLDFTDSFTFETWVNFDITQRTTDSYDWQCFLGKASFAASYGLMYLTEGQRRLRFYHTGFGTGFTDYFVNFNTNTWYHIAVTLSPTKASIIVNGVEEASQTAMGSLTPNNLPLSIGHSAGGAPYPLAGTLDETRLWNVTKTAAEINAGRFNILDGTESGLVLYYNYSDGTAGADNTSITTVTDISPNGNDATLNQFTLINNSSNFVSTTISGFNESTLSLDNFTKIKNIGIAPNPTQGMVYLSNNSNVNLDSYEIYNVMGQLVKKGIFDGTSLDLTQLPSDIYLVKVSNDSKGSIFKIIKE